MQLDADLAGVVHLRAEGLDRSGGILVDDHVRGDLGPVWDRVALRIDPDDRHLGLEGGAADESKHQGHQGRLPDASVVAQEHVDFPPALPSAARLRPRRVSPAGVGAPGQASPGYRRGAPGGRSGEALTARRYAIAWRSELEAGSEGQPSRGAAQVSGDCETRKKCDARAPPGATGPVRSLVGRGVDLPPGAHWRGRRATVRGVRCETDTVAR